VWKRFHGDRKRTQLRDKIGHLPAQLRGARRGWRWALRDIDLHAEPGDSIGLVGINGSGKSTLLKILCRVMYPYAGTVTAIGRVGALIEVRAGLSSDLTGRENIYLYGSLLGLRRKEVAQRFDEIVAFAEVDEAIDRQLKFYSSGMQMRLGFAVAAHLEPDILLVDEVLAVGDASFQQKCLDRMRYVLNQGTTLVYVSHDLPTVEATCSRGIWLTEGVVTAQGSIGEVLDGYRRSFDAADEYPHPESSVVRLMKTEVVGGTGNGIRSNGPLQLRFVIDSPESRKCRFHVGVTQSSPHPIFTLEREADLDRGETSIHCEVFDLPLPHGRYTLWVGVTGARRRDLLPWHRVTSFQVAGPRLDPPPAGVVRAAPIHVEAVWETLTS
jgi:ABC-2 type transport system ATP-binding protein